MSTGAERTAPPAPTGTGRVDFPQRLTGRIASALVRTALVLFALGLALDEPSPSWSTWAVPLLLLPTTVFPWLVVWGAWRSPWALRVDGEGVRWSPTGHVVPWSDVAEIEVRVARGLRRLLPHVSCVLLVTPAQAHFARRAGTRPIGYVVRLGHVRATPEALVAAFRPFTAAPARLRLR